MLARAVGGHDFVRNVKEITGICFHHQGAVDSASVLRQLNALFHGCFASIMEPLLKESPRCRVVCAKLKSNVNAVVKITSNAERGDMARARREIKLMQMFQGLKAQHICGYRDSTVTAICSALMLECMELGTVQDLLNNACPDQTVTDLDVLLLTAGRTGDKHLDVSHVHCLDVGDELVINKGGHTEESASVAGFGSKTCILLEDKLNHNHNVGEIVSEGTTRLRLQMLLHVCTDVLAGLAVMHEHRICHRDIKPANIGATMMPTLGRIGFKIIDLGIAVADAATEEIPPMPPTAASSSMAAITSPRRKYMTGVCTGIVELKKMRGTALFMSPVQLHPDRQVCRPCLVSYVHGLTFLSPMLV